MLEWLTIKVSRNDDVKKEGLIDVDMYLCQNYVL